MGMKKLVVLPGLNQKLSTTTIRPIAYTGETDTGRIFQHINPNLIIGTYVFAYN